MRNISNYQIAFDAITSATGLHFLQLNKVEAKSAEEAESDAVASDETHVEEGKATLCQRLTALGQVLLDLFATLNAINALNLDRSIKILGEFEYTEYKLLNCLKLFVRPRKVIVGAETGIKQLDLLEEYQPLFAEAPGVGRVLSPTEFENAQLKLLRAINKKCTALSDVAPISRETVTLTEELLLQYPVCSEEEMKAVAKSDVIRVFPLKHKFYDDEDYIAVYSRRYVEDAMIQLGNLLVKAANQRNLEQ